jgi:hypothetical protein
LDAQDHQGNTSLHIAVQFHQATCMQLLLNLGARGDLVNAQGQLALDLERDEGVRTVLRKGTQGFDILVFAAPKQWILIGFCKTFYDSAICL